MNHRKEFLEKKIMKDIVRTVMSKSGYELIAIGLNHGANANHIEELSTILKEENDESYWNYIAEPNPDVEGEWVVTLNGELFCHLSDMDLDNFINSCKYKVEIKEK